MYHATVQSSENQPPVDRYAGPRAVQPVRGGRRGGPNGGVDGDHANGAVQRLAGLRLR